MKKMLIMFLTLAGVFTFNGYGDSPKETEQAPIRGFGGYGFGGKLNPKQLNAKILEKGYIVCKAKKVFQNFTIVRLYFTPKTFVVYKIYAIQKGSMMDFSDIKASLETHYKEKMKLGFGVEYSLSRNQRTVRLGRGSGSVETNWISMTDDKLEKLNAKERAEIRQSKIADTSGL